MKYYNLVVAIEDNVYIGNDVWLMGEEFFVERRSTVVKGIPKNNIVYGNLVPLYLLSRKGI